MSPQAYSRNVNPKTLNFTQGLDGGFMLKTSATDAATTVVFRETHYRWGFFVWPVSHDLSRP